MIFASRRSRKGPDPHLDRKVALFGVGAVLAMAGIGLEASWLVGLAILVLAVGVGLGLFPRSGSSGENDNLRGDDGLEADSPD